MTSNSWRRTAFESISGDVEIAPDDWTLLDLSPEVAGLVEVEGDSLLADVDDVRVALRPMTWELSGP
jgi:hypothetical protein